MLNQQIIEEACDWFIRMRDEEDDAATRSQLMAWLRRSPEHVSAYLDVAGVWMELEHVQTDADVDITARIASARADKDIAELVPRSSEPKPGARLSLRSRNPRRMALAACAVLSVGAAVTAAWWTYGRQVYSTSLGEQRSIALADGSTVELDSQSQLRIRFDKSQRRIDLLRGQALFHVAKDRSRPFVVHADETAVRAVGTVFDVYKKGESAVVTVVEGAVVVEWRPPQMFDPGLSATTAVKAPEEIPVQLGAGKQVVVRRGTSAEPKLVNVSLATAWTQRRLVFESTSLGDVAEEFNRYNVRRLIVSDERVRAFKVSAIFRSTDPGSLVRFLQTQPGFKIEESAADNTIRITSAEP